MAGFFGMFRRGFLSNTVNKEIISELNTDRVQEQKNTQMITETIITEDHSENSLLYGDIESISEASVTRSPETLSKMLDTNDIKTEQLLSELKADFSLDETYRENEEMAKDSIIGSAMELVTDDVCQVDEKYKVIVKVESSDDKLAKFLQEFLENNINVEERVWEWTYEVVKHGDFKLRRREYYIGPKNKGVKDVYYENVLRAYKVSRIEYMGKVLGYMDEDFEEGKAIFEKPDTFIHFMNTKLPRREKVKVKIKNEDGELEDVVCYKVNGVSIMDNSRYIYRIVNLLDNMLVMARVARSTQYNLVKVEVGNASPTKTQQILSDVRRRVEGSTRIKKGSGMKSDPSPIPVNSNIYIPTRDGKGEVTVDSINESIDVQSITDIDYFRNKEFATIRVPKSYLGFEEELPGSMGNNSLVKLDIRYARPVQKVQTIIRYGIEELCNNYLRYRGRKDDVGKFDIHMRLVVSSENAAKVEEFVTNMQVFDSTLQMMENYGDYIDKAKMFGTIINLVGVSPTDVGSKKFLSILQEIDKGTYDEDKYKEAASEEEDEDY